MDFALIEERICSPMSWNGQPLNLSVVILSEEENHWAYDNGKKEIEIKFRSLMQHFRGHCCLFLRSFLNCKQEIMTLSSTYW